MSEVLLRDKPNIVFITFDSGRADHMGFMGYRKNTTPFLDSLANKGIYFKRAFATGPGSSVSFIGIFTSTYPLDYGGYSHIERPRVLLSEALKDEGYTTIGVHSSPYLSSYFGYDRGWDEFRYATYFRSKSGDGAKETVMSPGLRRGTLKSKILKKSASTHRWLKKYIPPLAVIFKIVEKPLLLFRKILKDIINFKPAFYTADEINEEVKRALPSRLEKPLLLWVHYLDMHVPYALFARKKGNFWLKVKYYLGDVLIFLLAETPYINRLVMLFLSRLYNESLRYVDEHIKQLLDYLKSLGVDETNSIVVVCADHGEEFLEHGNYGHSQRLFNVNIHIPLIFYGPQYFPDPQVIDRPVSLIDIAPTILDLAGLKKQESYKGKNLFDSEERPVVSQASECEGDLTGAVFTGITIISKGYKLIHWKDRCYLFSLDDEKEKNNLYNVEKGTVRSLEVYIQKYKPNK